MNSLNMRNTEAIIKIHRLAIMDQPNLEIYTIEIVILSQDITRTPTLSINQIFNAFSNHLKWNMDTLLKSINKILAIHIQTNNNITLIKDHQMD